MTKLLKPFLAVGNSVIRRLLRSRFHWLLSGNVVLLYVSGRKSGRTYLVPANYRQFSEGISVMTYRRRQWWRNIRSGTEVPVILRGRRLVAVAEVITEDLDAVAAGLRERGWMRRSTIRAKAKESVLIRLRLPRPENSDERERADSS